MLTGSPGQEYTLPSSQQGSGGLQPPLNPAQHGAHPHLRTRPGEPPPAALQQQQQQLLNKRPPLPPSPQASRAAAAAGSFNTLSPAWLNPGDGSGSGSGGRQPRILSAAAAAGSYGESGLLSSAVGGSSLRQYSQQHQQQQQQYGLYAASTGSAHSPSPGADGLLAAAVSSEDVATAAGNPYHPQHDSAMQLLLEHQAQQLQHLQQQRDHASAGSRAYMRAGSFNSSPRQSPRAPSRSSSNNR